MADSKYFLEKLQQFPHRGTCTPNAQKAAEMIADEFKKMGLESKISKFKTIRNDKFVDFLYFLLLNVGIILFIFGQFAWSIVFFALAIFMHLDGLFPLKSFLKPVNIIRFFYHGIAQNVSAQVLPENGKYEKTFVVLGHHDTSRWTIGLRIIGWLARRTKIATHNHKLPVFLRGPFIITNVSILLNIIIYFLPFRSLPQNILIGWILFTYALTGLIMTHTFLAPFIPGAFDNGSGTAAMMAAASAFQNRKPKRLRLIFWSNGSEESRTKGFNEFFKDNNIDKEKTIFLDLDGVGANVLMAAYGESRDYTPGLYDQDLFKILQKARKLKPEFAPIKETFMPIAGDGGALVEHECHVMSTIFSLNEDNFYDHYHELTDTIDKINFKSTDLCADFVKAIIDYCDSVDNA